MKIILTSVYNSDRWRFEWSRNVRNFNLCNIEEYIHTLRENEIVVATIFLTTL